VTTARWETRARSVLWLIPILVAVHNVEEALSFPVYLPRVRALAPDWVPPVTYSQMLLALGVVTLIPLALTAWAMARPDSRAALWAALLFQAIILVNVVSHLAVATFLLHGYAPGVITAVVLNLPFSIYLFRRVARERWLSRRALLALGPAALLVHGPVLAGLILLAGDLVRVP
jgi:hypothetical protein